ncbi:MAG: VOC family protein [Asticcacaulis sp.]|uniref:VOC family protein n=1 Tax=Asticcacaulis sp. TaxID=1872648 RepID=UPI0039E2309A
MASHFIWYELITSDIDAAISFYSDVIGWRVVASQTPGMDYRRIEAAGEPVGGMMKVPDGTGMPPAWFGYINVADVDGEITAFEAAGGRVCWPANDIPGIGRMAMVGDPQGATIYVMAPIGEGRSRAFESTTPGHCGWNEYHATDWEAAFAFYAGRFGWVKDMAMDMGPMGTYQTFTAEGIQTGAMMNNPLPQQAWLFYFNVGDIDAAMARIVSGGGTIQLAPIEVPGGQWALVAIDPQGAMFGLLGSRAAA